MLFWWLLTCGSFCCLPMPDIFTASCSLRGEDLYVQVMFLWYLDQKVT